MDILLGLRLFNDPEEILSKPAFAVISAGLTERAASHGCSKGRATCEARVPRFRLARGLKTIPQSFSFFNLGGVCSVFRYVCFCCVYRSPGFPVYMSG